MGTAFLLGGDESVLKLCFWLHNSLNTPKTTELP